MQATTAKDLLDFWPRIADQGLIAKPAASNYKNAVSAVLSGTKTKNEVDVKELDVQKLFRQFENLNATKYKPETITVIESRFRRALTEFLRWAENPKGFQPQIGQARRKDASNGKKKTRRKREKQEDPAEKEIDELDVPTDGSMIAYPLPLRPGVIAKLIVPSDLTESDVTRINAFLKTAVLPSDPKGGAS